MKTIREALVVLQKRKETPMKARSYRRPFLRIVQPGNEVFNPRLWRGLLPQRVWSELPPPRPRRGTLARRRWPHGLAFAGEGGAG